MMGLVLIIFLGVFITISLVLIAFTMEPERQRQQVEAQLNSVLNGVHGEKQDQVLDLRKEIQQGGSVLNRWLRHADLGKKLQMMVSQSGLDWTVSRIMAFSVLCFVVPTYLIYMRIDNLMAGLGAGLLAACIPMFFVNFRRGHRFNKFIQGLPDALDLMVSGLRAGHSLVAAMGLVARECPEPVGGEFRLCFDEQNYGLELKMALDNMQERMPLQDLRIVATAILIQKESGGNLAEVLDKAAHSIRERFRLKRQVAVHTAQGRMTGWVLTLLPIVLGIALYFANPTMMSILWTRPIGIKLMWTAGGMIVFGGLVIRHIVNMEV